MMYVEMKLLNFTFATFFIRPVIEGALGLPREIVSGVDLTIFPLVHPWPQYIELGRGPRKSSGKYSQFQFPFTIVI